MSNDELPDGLKTFRRLRRLVGWAGAATSTVLTPP